MLTMVPFFRDRIDGIAAPRDSQAPGEHFDILAHQIQDSLAERAVRDDSIHGRPYCSFA